MKSLVTILVCAFGLVISGASLANACKSGANSCNQVECSLIKKDVICKKNPCCELAEVTPTSLANSFA